MKKKCVYSFSFYKYFQMGKNWFKKETIFKYPNKKECTKAMATLIYAMKIVNVRYGMTPMIKNDPTLTIKEKDQNIKIVDFTTKE